MINSLLGLSPSDLCIKRADNCRNSFNRKQSNCELKCDGKINFQCGLDICTRNGLSCKVFRDWTMLLAKLMNGNLVESKLKYYENFIHSINYCQTGEYIWLPSHICINKKKCFEKIKWHSRLMFKGFENQRSVECECKGKFHSKCGNNPGYCGINEKACQQIKQRKIDDLGKMRHVLMGNC